jgi:hypothetical protein
MSLNAPAGTASKNIGRLPATCTIATSNGPGLRLVISHAHAALYIHVPMFDATVADHKTVNAGCLNAAHAPAAEGGGSRAAGGCPLRCGSVIAVAL